MKGNFLSGSGKYVSGFIVLIAFFLFMTLFSARTFLNRDTASEAHVQLPVD